MQNNGLNIEIQTENIGQPDERGKENVLIPQENSGPTESEKLDGAIVEESNGPNESNKPDVVVGEKRHIVQKNLDHQHVE